MNFMVNKIEKLTFFAYFHFKLSVSNVSVFSSLWRKSNERLNKRSIRIKRF